MVPVDVREHDSLDVLGWFKAIGTQAVCCVGVVNGGLTISYMLVCVAGGYDFTSLATPRSKMIVVDLSDDEVDGCLIKKESDGTVVLLSGSASVTKRLSGSVS
jgi:hypothetical protein